MSFDYVEYQPPKIWANDIETIWSLRTPPPVPHNLTEILPADGRVELIFGFAGNSTRQAGTQAPQRYAGAFLMGSRAQGYQLWHEGAAHFIAVRFRPAGLAAFLPVPLSEVADVVVDVEALWGREMRFLHERLYETPLPLAIPLIQDFLQRRFSPPNHYKAIQQALRQIHRQHGQIRMGQLAEDVNMSQKHLERLFRRYVGHTPKTYARIARFQGALRSLAVSQSIDVADLASRFGYFDQAHLTRSVRQLIGMTPARYQAAQYSVIQTYYEGAI